MQNNAVEKQECTTIVRGQKQKRNLNRWKCNERKENKRPKFYATDR